MRLAIMRFMCLVALGLIVSGCSGESDGKGKPKAKTYKVSGTVSYLGNPIAGAVVSFCPQSGQPAAVGRTNDDGLFSLTTYRPNDGAAAGDFRVLVMLIDSGTDSAPAAAHSPDGKNFDTSGAHSAGSDKPAGSLLPPKYADAEKSDLTAKVDPKGENKFTFDLK